MALWKKRRRQCPAASVENIGNATATDYCTRERGHDGPHANAFTQNAWIVKTLAVPVTYRWPYEDLIDDAQVTVKGIDRPQYRHRPKDQP